jgi:GNAT superfamily N-acetyltransferase
MSLQIVRATSEHIADAARILFESFKETETNHGFTSDIPNLEVAGQIVEMFVQRPDFFSLAAILDDKVIGTNFLQISDAVAGLGPITVDKQWRGRGIGRTLMQQAMDWGLAHHGPMIRLIQEAYNMPSLGLYASLGFVVKEPLVLMEVTPMEAVDGSVRALEFSDLGDCEELCRRITKVSRKNELGLMLDFGAKRGYVPHGRFKNGRLVAYAVPGLVDSAVGETVNDLLTVAMHVARVAPPPVHRMLVPMRYGDLFRAAIKKNMRCVKPMTLMAYGPYEEPFSPSSGAAWTGSVGY